MILEACVSGRYCNFEKVKQLKSTGVQTKHGSTQTNEEESEESAYLLMDDAESETAGVPKMADVEKNNKLTQELAMCKSLLSKKVIK